MRHSSSDGSANGGFDDDGQIELARVDLAEQPQRHARHHANPPAGTVVAKARERVGEQRHLRGRDRADPQHAALGGAAAALGEPRIERHHFLCERERLAARLVERRRAAGAVEQLKAEFLFEPLHLRADGRLREPDARARAGERAVLADGDEGFQLAEHDRSIDFGDGQVKYISFLNIFIHD
ncbi:hypothetical protein OKW36_003119 [Paraburkholderia sp. MM5482-R1]